MHNFEVSLPQQFRAPSTEEMHRKPKIAMQYGLMTYALSLRSGRQLTLRTGPRSANREKHSIALSYCENPSRVNQIDTPKAGLVSRAVYDQ
jgi:hypothetical protein